MADVETPAYGLDKELAAKIASKYDASKEKEVQDWIEQVTGTQFPGSFQESLKSGVLLCKLLNCIKKDAVPKINTQSMPFMQRENISYFLNGCRDLGMRNTDLFDTQDLYDNKNIVHVIESLHALAVFSRNVPTFRGPYIGHLRIAQKNERNFTEEQLAQAAAAPTLLAMGGLEAKKRASKEGGPDVILDRQIIQNVDMIKAEQKKSQQKANSCKGCGGPLPTGNFCGSCGTKRS